MTKSLSENDDKTNLWYVKVRFKSSDKQTYTYMVEVDASFDLSKMTHAVVDSPYNSLTVVRIEGFSPVDMSKYTGEYKHVVAMFDYTLYTDRIEREERKKVIEERIRKRISKKQFIENAQLLLIGDEEGEKLLKEWRSL